LADTFKSYILLSRSIAQLHSFRVQLNAQSLLPARFSPSRR
jgi:hypothetical protein